MMQSIPALQEARPFTLDTTAVALGAGTLLTVPGRFNVLLRVTSDISIPDLTLGFGPQPLLRQDLVDPAAPLECFLPFSPSHTDHRFMVQGTAASNGAVSFTFGQLDRPTC